jgi:hypothetical protein
LGAGKGGGAQVNSEAYALQGNAAESADFKSQSFGALVVHMNICNVFVSTTNAAANNNCWRQVA